MKNKINKFFKEFDSQIPNSPTEEELVLLTESTSNDPVSQLKFRRRVGKSFSLGLIDMKMKEKFLNMVTGPFTKNNEILLKNLLYLQIKDYKVPTQFIEKLKREEKKNRQANYIWNFLNKVYPPNQPRPMRIDKYLIFLKESNFLTERQHSNLLILFKSDNDESSYRFFNSLYKIVKSWKNESK